MEYLVSKGEMPLEDKLNILTDAAKYDVACTSSGVDRKGDGKSIGNCVAAGICHSFSGDGRCISLLKILMTNECIFDCKYCRNRRSNDVPRATFTPEEICTLTMEFYRRNYIEGLFLSSGIIGNPTFTQELICRMGVRMLFRCLLGARLRSPSAVGSSKLTLILSTRKPVCCMISGAAPGMAFTWT